MQQVVLRRRMNAGNGQQAASGTSSLPQPPHHGPAPHARADWQELTSLLQPEPQQQCTGMFQV